MSMHTVVDTSDSESEYIGIDERFNKANAYSASVEDFATKMAKKAQVYKLNSNATAYAFFVETEDEALRAAARVLFAWDECKHADKDAHNLMLLKTNENKLMLSFCVENSNIDFVKNVISEEIVKVVEIVTKVKKALRLFEGVGNLDIAFTARID
jgi:hypothetical protein